MSRWLAQHRLALSLVMSRMRRTGLATLMMMGVIGITLCLPAILYVAIDNLQRLAGGFGETPQISLFMTGDATEDTVQDVRQRLADHQQVASFQFIASDAAWQALQTNSGLSDLAATLDENPLPDAFIVIARQSDPDSMTQLQQELQRWPGVDIAQLDSAWVKRLHALLEIGNKVVLVIAGLLGFALLAITGNSIRLQILTQLDEIELARLVGATNRFIRRPFLYAGSLYGLGGGLAALLMLAATLWLFNLSIADLAQQYASDFRLLMPTLEMCLALLGIAMLLGWIGAYWAVQRSLSKLDSF